LCWFDFVVLSRIEIANVVIVEAEACDLPFGVDCQTFQYLCRAEGCELADALPPVQRPSALRTILVELNSPLSSHQQIARFRILVRHPDAIIGHYDSIIIPPRLAKRDLDPHVAGVSIPSVRDEFSHCCGCAWVQLSAELLNQRSQKPQPEWPGFTARH